MESLIKDQTEFDRFISIFPEMQKDEVAFISLAARNKYLNEEEREFYQLGRTEMHRMKMGRGCKFLKMCVVYFGICLRKR